MKKTLLLLFTVLITQFQCNADDFTKLKQAIISQLLSNSENDSIVKELSNKYFPKGVDSDLCLMELTAHSLPEDQAIEKLLSEMNSDGSWDYIEYTSPSRSAWVGQKHIENIMKFARSYKSQSSKFYKDPKLLDATKQAITYWCDNGFQCTNWWYNAIGVPKVMAPALLLLEDELPAELLAKGIKILEPAERIMTGQNKVWLNGVTFIKGLLLKDTSILTRTSNAIKEELVITTDEGIQPDFSYHQHGAMLQFGNYGLAFASSQSYWMRIFSGTSYDFTPSQKDIMRNYISKGINVTVWKGFMDVSSCGRQLFINTQAGKASSLLLSNLNMIVVDPQSKEPYENYITRNFITPKKNDLKGNFAFPISKYSIHRTNDFFFSVKMFSTKILGGEITNQENLKGYYLSDGATMIYRNGEEYRNIFPIWNGKYMPGTTVEETNRPLKVIKSGNDYVNGSDFTGNLSDNNMYGLAALEYDRDGVRANKSWFFLDSVVVCLGNNITSENGNPLVTTLNQCNFQDVAYFTDGKTVTKMNFNEKHSSTKVFSDNIAYETLDNSPIEFIAKEQSGTWHDVAKFLDSDKVYGNVFTAQIRHKAGETGEYAYIVRPTAERNQFLTSKSKNNFIITQNNSQATVVETTNSNIALVVFWEAGEIKTKTFKTVKASAPVMAIIKKVNNKAEYKCYDPYGKDTEITLTK